MPVNPQTRYMTYAEFDQYAALPAHRDRLLQLFMGELIEKMPTQRHGIIAVKIASRLLAYAETHGGRVGTEMSMIPSQPIYCPITNYLYF